MRYRTLPKIQRRNSATGAVWWAEWWDSPQVVDGKRTRPHHSAVLGDCRTTTKGAARERLDSILNASPTSPGWTLADFVQRIWLPARVSRWAAKTRELNESMLNKHILPVFGRMRLDALLKCQVEEWLRRLADAGLSRNTGCWLLTCLRSILADAEDNGLIERNPTTRIKLPEMVAPKKTQAYTLAEVKMLAAIDGLDGLAMRVLLFCGLRPGEMLALRAGDVRGRELVIDESTDYRDHTKAPKTGETRPGGIPPRLAADLAALAEGVPGETLLFGTLAPSVNALGKKWTGMFGPMMAGFTLRRCRATFATLIQADPADVRDLLGHKTMAMLEHYRRGIPARQLEALEKLEGEAIQ